MIFAFNSEKLQSAKLALKQAEKKETIYQEAYKVVSGGVTIYYGTKAREADEAYADTARKDKQLWKVSQGVAKRLK